MNDCQNCTHRDNESSADPCLSCNVNQLTEGMADNWEPIKMNESTDQSQQLIADYEAKIKALTEDRDVWKDAAQQISKAFTAMKEKKDGEPSRVAELEEELKKVKTALKDVTSDRDSWSHTATQCSQRIDAQYLKIKKLKKAFLKMV